MIDKPMKSHRIQRPKIVSQENQDPQVEINSSASYKAKKMQELQRLKNICFPKKVSHKYSVPVSENYSFMKDRNDSVLRGRGRDFSEERLNNNNYSHSLLDKPRNSSAGHRNHSNFRKMSFNKSPPCD
jgi:hypothetical protein